ncbi:MAG TPA: hypothetical protein VH165_06570 [Kofleriaceae bacterium]|nr:hypothetical protein [Kofleriaceae bacterium]
MIARYRPVIPVIPVIRDAHAASAGAIIAVSCARNRGVMRAQSRCHPTEIAVSSDARDG